MEPTLDQGPREYTIRRSAHKGYGFVAGHESPTMVKFVEPNGPSYNRLLQGDIILAVNGINVQQATREEIIKMIQMSDDQITITVMQPTIQMCTTLNRTTVEPLTLVNDERPRPTMSMDRIVTSIAQQQQQMQRYQKPALPSKFPNFISDHPPGAMPSGSQTILRNRTINNRDFAGSPSAFGRHSPLLQRCKSSIGGVLSNGSPSKKQSSEGQVPKDEPLLKRRNTMQIMKIMKTVTRVFLEDETQSRVFNYNETTTVGNILETLHDRTIRKSAHSDRIKSYFGLVLTVGPSEDGEKEQEPKRNMFFVLDENDSISKIAKLYYSHRLRFIYRMVNQPKDLSLLYSQDKMAFNYLYMQSCNDLRLERFGIEMDHDTALKLLCISLVEHVHTKHHKDFNKSKNPKAYIRLVKETPGIDHYFPASMVEKKKIKGEYVISNYKKLKTRLADQLKKNFDEFDFEAPTTKTTTNINRYSSTSFHELALPEMASSPDFYLKLLFLNFLSQLPCYSKLYKDLSNRNSSPQVAGRSSAGRNSAGDYSSSLESMARGSDSSPLIRQDQRNQANPRNLLPRLVPTSPSSINSEVKHQHLPPQHNQQQQQQNQLQLQLQPPQHQPDQQINFIPQTPSTESISSITFNNSQTSPSPQLAPPYLSATQHSENYHLSYSNPSPMPRQQIVVSKPVEYFKWPLEDMLVLPPPPAPTRTIVDTGYQMSPQNYLTQLLTESDLDDLKVPPPPPPPPFNS